MEVKITKTSPDWLANRMGEMTTHGKKVKASIRAWIKSEHSPLRGIRYWIEILGLPTFVSVHLVRHKFGVEHFVQSKREDLRPDKDKKVDRETPINHGMDINAQEIIFISRRRLCYKASVRTIAVWRKVVKQLARQEPDLAKFCVPECVYRAGICPEFKMCKPGIKKVMKAYKHYPLLPEHTIKWLEEKE